MQEVAPVFQSVSESRNESGRCWRARFRLNRIGSGEVRGLVPSEELYPRPLGLSISRLPCLQEAEGNPVVRELENDTSGLAKEEGGRRTCRDERQSPDSGMIGAMKASLS